MGLLATSTLAGCGEREIGLSEYVDEESKINSRVAAGESIGIRYGSEQWSVTIETMHDDGSIDITAEKVLLDEVGQDKEGTDARLTFKRSGIEEHTIRKIENDLRVWYISREGDRAWIAVGDAYLEKCSTSRDCSRDRQ